MGDVLEFMGGGGDPTGLDQLSIMPALDDLEILEGVAYDRAEVHQVRSAR